MSDRRISLSTTELDARILALPLGHLQLSERVRLALRERETIGGLIAAFELGSSKWSALVRSEVSLVLNQLARYTGRDWKDGWDRFRRRRPKAADSTAIYFTSFSLDRLAESVRDLPVGTLHVSTRATTALARAKIETLGDLIDAATRGLVNPRPAGAGTCLEIIEMLDALSEAVEANGECAWDRYANSRRIILLPRHGGRRFVAEEYIREFPAVIQTAVLAEFGQRGVVLARQHLLCIERRASLNRIATQFAVTRQGVKRVRERIVRRLRAAFLKADYAGCWFRFRPEFVWPLRVLARELSRARDRAIAYSEWEKILRSCWLTTPKCLGPVERGLLEILGFQLVTVEQPRFKPIILPFDREAAPFRRAMTKAEQLLTRDFAAGLSKAELFHALRKEANGGQLREADIKAVIGSLPGVRRRTHTERYECRLGDLETVGDRLERGLRKVGTAAHFRQLARLVNQAVPAARKSSERSVAVSLSADKRFTPVARTGLWALTEWRNVETRSIAELARVFLTQHNRPATEGELYEFILRLRKVAKESIRTELKRDSHFLRVAPRTWALGVAGGHQ